ncbi:MAG: MATE family efflux transporter [Oscillospiraceae bacterium]|nr:MATE family efflux transporter [Oscillospiraceae bacterium]
MRGNISPKKQQMMLEENIRTLIPKMAVPTIVAQLITTIYNLVDTYFVSTIGTQATAAVGVNSSLERTITLLGSLIGAGACSYIARLLGAKRKEDADRVLSTSLFTGLALGLVLMAAGLVIIRPLVYLLGANEDCVEYSMQYARYVLLAAPFMIGSFILNMCLRSEGSATFAMVGIGFGGVLNCFLDPLFIRTFGLGVAGASMATAISKTISFCILLYPYLRKNTSVDIALRKFRLLAADVKEVLAIGSTSFFRSALAVVAMVTINRVASAISTPALAALSVANRVMEFPFAFILGFGQGYQPVVGYNWGARQYGRVRESLSFSAAVSVIGAIIVGGALAVMAGQIVMIFNSQADADVLSIGILCIRLQCAVLFSHALNSIINMFFAGIGDARRAILMSTARQGYVFIPIALILPRLFGATGVASVQAAADLICLVISVPLMITAYRLIAEREREQTAD